ncbi:hypothetical protein KsCSTR_33830 [Candidatus Kuenenia stuttgartiensis]|uniref:Uncharacterized protein n=1 Tax=Kuenenia stuttgartiensis TaxID=174633 RepID=A0A6G7GTS8_KUEST|nr:hypothetical protein KsCSTR_33830 [Candidatus Kuenenia stuttgartiensis]
MDRKSVGGWRKKRVDKKEGGLTKYTLLCNLNYVFVNGMFT